MKKSYLMILVAALTLSSCSSNYKVRNIISFTNLLNVEDAHTKVILQEKGPVSDWYSDRNNLNIDARDTSYTAEFAKLKLRVDISVAPLVTGDKIVVLCTDGTVNAFSSDGLQKLWTTSLVGQKNAIKSFMGGIAHHDGKLFVASGTQMLDILDLETGRKIISKKFPDVIIAPPIVHKDLILLLTLGNQLFAVDKRSQAIIWDHAGSPETLTYGNLSSVSIDDKSRVFVSYSSGQIYSINGKDGSVLWQYDLSIGGNLPGLLPTNVTTKPIVEDDNIYLADSNGQFYKFNTNTGGIVWKREIQDVQTINNGGNALFVTTNARQIVAVNKANGKIIWAKDIPDEVSLKEQKPPVEDIVEIKEEVSSKTDGVIGKISTFFKRKLHAPKAPKVKMKPVVDRAKLKPLNFITSALINDTIVLYTSNGAIYYLSPLDGKILDYRNLKTKLSSVVVFDSVVIVSGKKILK